MPGIYVHTRLKNNLDPEIIEEKHAGWEQYWQLHLKIYSSIYNRMAFAFD